MRYPVQPSIALHRLDTTAKFPWVGVCPGCGAAFESKSERGAKLRVGEHRNRSGNPYCDLGYPKFRLSVRQEL